METIQIGNIYYFLEIFIAIAYFFINYFILKNKDRKFIIKYLLVIALLNFSLHFIKQLVYMDLNAFRKSTAENICAISTLIFPFILLNEKNGPIHDFMFFIGMLGGLAGTFYPTEAINKIMLVFEVRRFYFCHVNLWTIPLLLAVLGIYKPRFKYLLLMPLFYLGYQLILVANTALLCYTPLYGNMDGLTSLEMFFSRQYANWSYTFGPGLSDKGLDKILSVLTPSFMKIDIFNINGGQETYWPGIWQLIPAYILFTPIAFILFLPFNIKKKNR